ncbi:MAG: hypothetical protein N4A49_15870 [Marinifilaceae bacterium]|jgi:chemotaxis protein histidine kinase CheA|nr:hypothetical protein [Marinifilaceae bacterium]
MKKFYLLVLVFCLGLNLNSSAQESVEKATKYAKRLTKKIKGGNFKKFNSSYSKALEDINKIISKAEKSEFGYDEIVFKAKNWIKMNNYLRKFESGEIKYKDNVIKLELQDYKALRTKARGIATTKHAEAARKIINSNTAKFDEKVKALNHYTKISKLAYKTYKDNYKAEHDKSKCKVYYNEGVRILKTAKTWKEKELALNKFKRVYSVNTAFKDTKQKIVSIYSTEASKLMKTRTVEANRAAYNHTIMALKYDKTNANLLSQKKAAKNNIADIYFTEAQKNEKIKTYEAQKTASNLYAKSHKWIPNYKGSKQKAIDALNRCKLTIVVADSKGKCIKSYYSVKLGAYTKAPFKNPKNFASLESNYNLKSTDCIKKIEASIGGRLVFIRVKRLDNIDYKVLPEQTNSENIDKYYGYQKKNGEWVKEEQTLSQHNAAKKVYNFGHKQTPSTINPSTFKFEEFHGKLITTNQKSVASQKYIVEVYDSYKSIKPTKIFTLTDSKTIQSSGCIQRYEGPSQAKPSSLKNKKLRAKTEMISSLKNSKDASYDILSKIASKIGTALNNKITYVAY